MYVYYIDGEKFKTKYYSKILFINVSSLNEQTPAIEGLADGFKFWCEKEINYHRLTGPARIWSDGTKEFYLNGKYYENIHDWLKDHPNPDLYFDAIGIFTETDKILWYLQN
jgi:hypothetical protein